MVIDPTALATLTSAVSILGSEYLKGVADDAGKATWHAVRTLFGWKEDLKSDEISEKVATALAASPDLAYRLLQILKSNPLEPTVATMVGKIEASAGKIVVAQTIVATTFSM